MEWNYAANASSQRRAARYYWDTKKRKLVEHYGFGTPGLLLINRDVYAEALGELRKKPLVMDLYTDAVMAYFKLTIAHLIPFRSLKKIEHLHFDHSTIQLVVDCMLVIVWGGALLTADINCDVIHRGASFPGLLKANLPEGTDRNAKKPHWRHLDTFPQGEYSLRKISFEHAFDTPVMVELEVNGAVSVVSHPFVWPPNTDDCHRKKN